MVAEEPEVEKENQQSTEEELSDLLALAGKETAPLPEDLVSEPPKEFTPEERGTLYQKILRLTIPQRIRLAFQGNKEARNILVHDPNKVVALTVIRSPRIVESEILAFAQMKGISEDVLLAIAREKNWIKSYQIKLALASNPKTPLPLGIRLLDHLREKDLQELKKNRNVSPILCRQAARTLLKRKG